VSTSLASKQNFQATYYECTQFYTVKKIQSGYSIISVATAISVMLTDISVKVIWLLKISVNRKFYIIISLSTGFSSACTCFSVEGHRCVMENLTVYYTVINLLLSSSMTVFVMVLIRLLTKNATYLGRLIARQAHTLEDLSGLIFVKRNLLEQKVLPY